MNILKDITPGKDKRKIAIFMIALLVLGLSVTGHQQEGTKEHPHNGTINESDKR